MAAANSILMHFYDFIVAGKSTRRLLVALFDRYGGPPTLLARADKVIE
jgi:hypothetical protein